MRCLVLCLCWLACIEVAAAADKLSYGPVPAWVVAAPPAAENPKDSEAAIKILLLDQQLNLDPSGDEVYTESKIRIQNPQGLAAMSTLNVSWKPETDIVTIHKFHILRGNERVDVLEGGQSFTVLRRENNLEYSALDGVLTGTIQPTGLRVGDTINVAYTLKRADPVLSGISQQIVGGWPELPISRVRVRARWPSSSSIRWRPSAAITAAKESKSSGYTEVSLALDDIEPLLQPAAAPLRFRKVRELEFSGFKSWSDVSARLGPLYARASKLGPQSPLHKEIAEIRKTASTEKEYAAAALVLVQDQVRYVFLGMNDGGLVPADSDLTWSRRFGDCKAKTALLLALLREFEIDADAVAVHSVLGDGLNTRLPMMGLFNHVLVRAVIEGKTYWLDGTRTGDRRLDSIAVPGYRWGLPLVSEGSELVSIPVVALSEPTMVTQIRIDAKDGINVAAPFHVETVLSGDAATAYNLQFSNLTSTDRDRALRAYWTEMYNFVEVQSVSSKFDAALNQQSLAMDGSAKMDWKGNLYYTDGMRVGFDADFKRPAGDESDAPFAVQFPIYSRTTETIVLPNAGANFRIDGANYDTVVAGIEYKRLARIERGVFSAEASIRSVSPEFPFAEAADAQKKLREMYKNSLSIHSPKDYVLTDKEVSAELLKSLTTVGEYIDRGFMLSNRGTYDLAIADFDKALALDPKSSTALANRGIANAWKREYALAQKDFDAAFEINPRSVVVFRGRGFIAVREGRMKEAIDNFTTALTIEPNNAFSLQYRARAYLLSGQTEAALKDAAEAIKLKPTIVDMYQLRAAIFETQRKTEKVLEEISALIAANPDNGYARSVAGIRYANAGMPIEAMREFDRALELVPSESNYLTRALHRSLSDTVGRAADVDAALRINPNSVQALSLKGYVQLASGDHADAIATFGKVLALKADDEEATMGRGVAYAKTNQEALAEKDYSTVRAKASSANLLNNLCWRIATHNVSLNTALSICDEAITKAPGVARYIDSRAFVLLRLSRFKEAIETYDSALKLHSTLAASLYCRGIAKRRLGDTAGGNSDIKAAQAVRSNIAEEYSAYGINP